MAHIADVLAMPDDKPRISITTILVVGQIAVMVVGFGGMIYALGGKAEQMETNRRDLDRLADTAADLARAQASAAVADATQQRSLEDIQRRLDAIERRISEVHR
jgi:hypothetical protein